MILVTFSKAAGVRFTRQFSSYSGLLDYLQETHHLYAIEDLWNIPDKKEEESSVFDPIDAPKFDVATALREMQSRYQKNNEHNDWIKHDSEDDFSVDWECPFCGYTFTTSIGTEKVPWHFCPVCGETVGTDCDDDD